MFRRRRSGSQSRSSHSRPQSLFNFMRRPAMQIGFVVFAALVVAVLAINGQKMPDPVFQTPVPELTVTTQTQLEGTSVPDVISVSAAHDLYLTESAYLLDVRERTEWDRMHIPATTLLPIGQVQAMLGKFPKDKLIIVISASDNRSQQGRDLLKKSGYSNVTSMAGGITYWRTQGFPVEP